MESIKMLVGAVLLLAAGAAMASEDLAQSKGCLVCHSIDSNKLGPAYVDVAQRYAGQADAEAKLTAKVIEGGAGSWGDMAMQPNNITPEEAKQLVQWILTLK
ncbi:c-type cytochrome [Methylococcus sp. EFPC2]|uniref:c-type cytochrome n=1 Tax=Methylococcus sp. EFPC2 TaxID=2812648 RepID=UPI0019674214|nr:c-type cytochrome [Methylococcus sp. EFPC2]QSA98855.1 c-type cytochrome [Methylococcus sp. EFPC2]